MKEGVHHQRVLKVVGLTIVLLLVAACFVFTLAQRRRTASQPESTANVTYTKPGEITVGAKGDFQAALNAAKPGDTIILEAGATYIGPFTLPNKAGSAWITIQSSALSQLPDSTSRVSPQHASLMPRLVTQGQGAPVIRTDAGAHHYRFIGLEFTRTSPSAVVYELIHLGKGDSSQNTLDKVPHHLTFDRCYIHGDSGELKRGIGLNSASTAIVNSYISEIHRTDVGDTQAIMGWNGPGPFQIINNYLEAAGENVMFGGADPSIENLVPSDIEFRGNHCFKPLAWKQGHPSYAGKLWQVKNLFEIKNGRRVVIDGNIFENNWHGAQGGGAIVLTPRNQDGAAPWSTLEDITFTNNIVKHAGSGISLLGQDDTHPSQRARRIIIRNNLFEDINEARWGISGNGGFGISVVGRGAESLKIINNTIFNTIAGVRFTDNVTVTGLEITNNIMRQHIIASGEVGSDALNLVSGRSWVCQGNLIVDNPLAKRYPADNYTADGWEAVGFISRATGNYRLAPSSSFRNRGTERKGIGCDFDALYAAIGIKSPAQPSPEASRPRRATTRP